MPRINIYDGGNLLILFYFSMTHHLIYRFVRVIGLLDFSRRRFSCSCFVCYRALRILYLDRWPRTSWHRLNVFQLTGPNNMPYSKFKTAFLHRDVKPYVNYMGLYISA